MKSASAASIAAAVAAALTLAAAQTAHGQRERVKCYGVTKAGQNDCATPNRTHSCAGQSKVDRDPNEWKYIDGNAETCRRMGGTTQPPPRR